MDPALVTVATFACYVVAVLLCLSGMVVFNVGKIRGSDSRLTKWGYRLILIAMPVALGGLWTPVVTAGLVVVALLLLLVFAASSAISAWVGRD